VQSDSVAELVRLSHELMDAIRTRNRTTLDDVLLPDFAQVDERGNRQGKEAFISAVEASEFHVERLTFETILVERFDRVGVVCGVQRAQVRLPGGEQVEGRTAFTDVFVQGASGWRLRLATSAELVEANRGTA
jgi:ketosteroid isomerase-like protein